MNLNHIRTMMIVKAMLREGLAAPVPAVEHIIDCDADPFVPDGWEVVEHHKGGQFKWNKEAQKDALYLSAAQKNGSIEGNKLRKELVGKPVLNANALDDLLANPHLIPEEWKDKYVFFWGTVYRISDGDLFVRFLYWDVGGWYSSSSWLGVVEWRCVEPAALRA